MYYSCYADHFHLSEQQPPSLLFTFWKLSNFKYHSKWDCGFCLAKKEPVTCLKCKNAYRWSPTKTLLVNISIDCDSVQPNRDIWFRNNYISTMLDGAVGLNFSLKARKLWMKSLLSADWARRSTYNIYFVNKFYGQRIFVNWTVIF